MMSYFQSETQRLSFSVLERNYVVIDIVDTSDLTVRVTFGCAESRISAVHERQHWLLYTNLYALGMFSFGRQ